MTFTDVARVNACVQTSRSIITTTGGRATLLLLSYAAVDDVKFAFASSLETVMIKAQYTMGACKRPRPRLPPVDQVCATLIIE